MKFELPPLNGPEPKKNTDELKFDLPDVGLGKAPGVTVGERYLNSQYDVGTTSENNPAIYRAERQGAAAELGNGLRRTLMKIPVSVLGNLGAIADIEDYYNQDKEVGNWLTEITERSKKNIDAANPIYGSEGTLDIGDREWWVDRGSNLIESAGSFVATGYGLGKGLSMLNSLRGGQIAGAITSAVALNQAESIPTAMNVFNTTYKYNLDKGLTDDEAKQEAADAAAYSININRLNIPLNLTSSLAFLRSPNTLKGLNVKAAQQSVLDQLEGLSFRGGLKGIMAEGAQETLEETVNNISEKEALRRGKEGKDYQYSFQNTVKDIFSKEGLESAFLGFLGGTVQTGGTSALNQISGVNTESSKKLNLQLDALKRLEILGKTEGLPTVKQLLDNVKIQGELMDKIQDASLVGNDLEVNTLKNELLSHQSLQAFKTGTKDQLIDTFKSILADPSMKEQLGPEYATKVQEAIKNINRWEKDYNKLANTFHPDLVDDLFKNRVNTETVLNILDEKSRELQELQGKHFKNTTHGVPNTEIEEELVAAQAEYERYKEKALLLDEEYRNMRSPEYLEEKLKKPESVQEVKPEELPVDEAVSTGQSNSESNQTIKNGNDDSNESFPSEVTPKIKERKKTTVTNIAHKTFEQGPDGRDLIGPDGKKVKTKVSIDLSSPDLAQSGEELIYFVDNAYSGPETTETPIAIALKSRPSEIIGYVHNEDWIENGVADSAKDKVRAETKAIRDAVMNSDIPVEGLIANKTYNPEALNRDGNKFTHSLVDSFGSQSPINPNKFGESEIVFVDGDRVYRGEDSLVTGVSFANIDKTKPGIKMMIPTPVKEEVYFTRVEPQTLKTLGQTKVIRQVIDDYLSKKEGYLELDELIDFVHKLDAKIEGEEGNVFALSNVDGKLQIQYGNSSFVEGDELSNSFDKYLDGKPLNIDYKKLNSKEPFSTYKVGKNGGIVEDIKYENYSQFLGQKVLKTNIIPEITSNNERVFFAQPNIEIALKAVEQAPVVSTEDQLVKSIEDGDIQAALGVIAGIEGKYTALAKELQGSVGNTPIQFSNLKVRGRFADGTIYINPKQNQDQLIEAIVHESIHAATVAKIEAYNRGEASSLTEKDLKAIKALERLMQNASKPKRLLTKEESAGFTNLPEFVAMTLSNESFQELLNNTPYNKDKSLMSRIFEVLSQLLGVNVKPGSALEQAAKDAMNLLKDEALVPSTGSYDLKFFERESTGDEATDKYLDLLDTQIRTLRDQRTEENGQEIDMKIWGLRKYQGMLTNKQGIFKTYRSQLKEVFDTLNKKDVSFKNLMDTQDTLLSWNALAEILDAPDGSTRAQTEEELSGKVDKLRKKWLKVAKKKLLEESNGKLSKRDLEVARDINWTARESLSSNVSPVALEAEMKKLMDVMSFRASEEIAAKHKSIEEAVKKLGGKKNFANLLQLDKSGNVTGNLISEFDPEQEKEISELNLDTKEGLERLLEIGRRPVITQEIKEKYKADLETFKKAEEERLLDKYKDLSKPGTQEKYDARLAKNIKDWERENSPMLRREAEDEVIEGTRPEKELKSMKGNRYLPDPTPTKKDPRYSQLTAKEKEFLDFFKGQFKEYLPYLAINTNVRDNTLPNLRRTFTEDFLKNPIKSLVKGTGKKLMDNIAVDEDSSIEYGNLDATNRPIRRLKTRMIGNNLSPDEKSYDLEEVLKAWVNQAAGIKYKAGIENQVLVAQRVLANMKAETGKDTWTGKPQLIDGGLENVQKRFGYTVDALLYDIRKEVEFNMGKIDGKEVKGSKVGDAVIKTMQANALVFNPIAGMTNLVMGTLTNFTYSADGRDFTDKDMFRAFGTVMKAINPLSENHKKLKNVMDKLQILGEINPSNYGGKSIMDKGYVFLKKGEEIIQGQTTVAALNNIKMSDGKTSLWDALDVDGNIKPEFKDSGYGFEGGKATLKTVELSNKIRHIIASTQGDYDPRNPKMMKKKLIGRALSVFKNWLPRAYQARFGEERFDSYLGRTVKGRYKSIGKLSKDVNGLKNIFALSILGKMSGAKVEGLSQEDEANLRLVARELLMIASMYGATVILKGLLVDEDDEEAKAIYQLLLNTTFRVENELSFWTSPAQFTEMVKNPMAPLRVIDDLNQLIGATEDFVIGDAEIGDVGKKALKLTPAANQIMKISNMATKDFAENFGTKLLDEDED